MKKQSSKGPIKATGFRIVLAVSIVLIVALSGVGFSYGVGFVQSYAKTVSEKQAQSKSSDENIQQLIKTKAFLEENSSVINKIAALRTNGKSNEHYPEIEIINIVRSLAAKNDISVTGIAQVLDSSGQSDGATPGATGSTAPATPPAGSAASTPGSAATGSTPQASSSETVAVSVTLGESVEYESYLQFLYDIEQNIPLLKVDSVNVSHSAGASPNKVSAGDTTIHLFIKKN